MKPKPSQAEQAPPRGPAEEGAGDRYQGFCLRSVTWGYRKIFENAIEELFQQGYLGSQRQEVTAKFFGLMKQADQSCFDHVLRQFLGALNPANRWIMDLPGIFADVTETGGALAASRLYYGTRFFETLAKGGMGTTPQEVRECLGWLRRLREIDEELAMAFLSGYARLSRRLRPLEMERYIDVAIEIHHRSNESGCAFLRGELRTSETYILALTQECRLCDVNDTLAAMIKALTSQECEIASLSQLDADDLIERGTQVLALHGHLYLPERSRRFDRADLNRKWYLLCGIACASMLLEDSFARIHGHREYRTCAELVGQETWRVNLFQIIEFVRVLRGASRRWPGARRLVAFGLQSELGDSLTPHSPERAVADAMDDSLQMPALITLRRIAEDCVNCFDAAARLDEPWAQDVVAAYPAIASRHVRPTGFLSDFLFPVSFSDSPPDQLVADLKDTARRHRCAKDADDLDVSIADSGDGNGDVDGEQTRTARREAAFIYDEWDFQQNAYRSSWCHLHQKHVEPSSSRLPQADWLDQARKVRAVFERLKPDMARREKRLSDGDDINADRLLEHLLDRHRDPSPPVRFYEKPLVNHRDLAVLILLDVSGSTGEQLGRQAKVLDVEKQAAIILGQGLAALGDRFAVCGFSSNGREQCEYLTFKSFDDSWSGDAIGRVMAAWPRSSTRMGPALRHSGYLLSLQPARQRLIILVTDGKPMDQGYDPNTRYAQHDVRMACEENARNDVHTFGISTEENSLADMEIMFPRRRFVILPDVGQLPRILPQLYLRLTL
ncbi:MAG: hypothetical protein AMK72_00670 [Planctomycetes bacterium SM23_25]|nr:MAG: hypothetical protein AMK72_00670 [Planctomycetes bacterium SM23_25]